MTTTPASQERIVLYNVTWDTYECLLKNYEQRSAPRFTFDRGTLEIISPLISHEETNRATGDLVKAVLNEWDWDYRDLGSSTFKRQDRDRGFEPDTCFYIANLAQVRGKNTLDLAGGDPAPDLVIEIDETSSSLPKLPILADFGVPEVWRLVQGSIIFYLLDSGVYSVADTSAALPALTSATVNDWLGRLAQEPRSAWLRTIRQWAQDNPPPP